MTTVTWILASEEWELNLIKQVFEKPEEYPYYNECMRLVTIAPTRDLFEKSYRVYLEVRDTDINCLYEFGRMVTNNKPK